MLLLRCSATLLIAFVLLNVSNATTVCERIAAFFLEDTTLDLGVLVEGLERNKPIGVSSKSLCPGMKGTCCKPSAEPELLRAMERDYSRRYLTALQRRMEEVTPPLFSSGRTLNSAVFSIFNSSRSLLVTEIAKVMNKSKVATDTSFDDLFDHIYKLVHTKDLCFLPSKVNLTIRMIFDREWQRSELNATINSTRRTAIEEAIIKMWYRPVLEQLAPTLNNIKIIAESFEVINAVSLTLLRNKFSDSCLSALFTIQRCAACGGYHKTVACDGHCLNVMRGCMAEAVELTPGLKMLASKIKDFSRFISHQMSPVLLTANVLSIFFSLTKHINATLSNLVIDTENYSTVSQYSTVVLDQDRFSLYSAVMSTSHTARKGYTTIAQATEKELGHFSILGTLITEVPEMFCSVNPQLLKYIRNQDCWNGTALGSYTYPLVGRFEADQASNPAFKSKKHLGTGQYRRPRNKIKRLTQAVSSLLSLYECLESDDEDCEYKTELTCSVRPKPFPTNIPEHGSGEGSGSGDQHAVGSGHIDAENPNSRRKIVIKIVSDLKQNQFGNPSGIKTPTTIMPPTNDDPVLPDDDVVNTPQHNTADEEDMDYDAGETQGTPHHTTRLNTSDHQVYNLQPTPSGGSTSLIPSFFLVLSCILILCFSS